jgi:hypothetical protein
MEFLDNIPERVSSDCDLECYMKSTRHTTLEKHVDDGVFLMNHYKQIIDNLNMAIITIRDHLDVCVRDSVDDWSDYASLMNKVHGVK